MSDNIEIRSATVEDAPSIAGIYAEYVKNTAVTFEYEAPSAEEMKNRIERVLKRYPYLVAVTEGRIVGFSYAAPFRPRAAYEWSVETSIYVDRDRRGQHIGSALYKELEKELAKRGVLNLYACIATIDFEDEHLTNASVRFHERCGFAPVGTFKNCANKFGKWYDMVYMGKFIGEHESDPAPIRCTA